MYKELTKAGAGTGGEVADPVGAGGRVGQNDAESAGRPPVKAKWVARRKLFEALESLPEPEPDFEELRRRLTELQRPYDEAPPSEPKQWVIGTNRIWQIIRLYAHEWGTTVSLAFQEMKALEGIPIRITSKDPDTLCLMTESQAQEEYPTC